MPSRLLGSCGGARRRDGCKNIWGARRDTGRALRQLRPSGARGFTGGASGTLAHRALITVSSILAATVCRFSGGAEVFGSGSAIQRRWRATACAAARALRGKRLVGPSCAPSDEFAVSV